MSMTTKGMSNDKRYNFLKINENDITNLSTISPISTPAQSPKEKVNSYKTCDMNFSLCFLVRIALLSFGRHPTNRPTAPRLFCPSRYPQRRRSKRQTGDSNPVDRFPTPDSRNLEYPVPVFQRVRVRHFDDPFETTMRNFFLPTSSSAPFSSSPSPLPIAGPRRCDRAEE